MAALNTGKVTDRRQLRFETIDDLLADIDRIVTAEKAGTLRRTGNWTAGQAFSHIATWANFAYDGFPPQANPPWFIRPFIRMQKSKYLGKGMPAGIHIPRIEGGTLGTELVNIDEGADRLRRVLQARKYRIDFLPLLGPIAHKPPALDHGSDTVAARFVRPPLQVGYVQDRQVSLIADLDGSKTVLSCDGRRRVGSHRD